MGLLEKAKKLKAKRKPSKQVAGKNKVNLTMKASTKTIEAEISSLRKEYPEGWISLLEIEPEKSLELLLSSLKALTDKDYTVFLVSSNLPCTTLHSHFKEKNIDIEKVYIVDCVCVTQGLKPDVKQVFHLDGVSALTNMSIVLSKLTDSLTGKRVIVIDSMNNLLLHNDAGVLARFVHGLINKMRLSGISGLLFSSGGEADKEVHDEISQLCDKTITL